MPINRSLDIQNKLYLSNVELGCTLHELLL